MEYAILGLLCHPPQTCLHGVVMGNQFQKPVSHFDALRLLNMKLPNIDIQVKDGGSRSTTKVQRHYQGISDLGSLA